MKEAPQNPGEPEASHELRYKLSKTALHVGERRRYFLFDVLTAKNAEKITKLLAKKPVFYQNKENLPQQLLLDPEIAELLPPEFFENPTKWIESQDNIKRGYDEDGALPTGDTIRELFRKPYDVSKVKMFNLKDEEGKETQVVSKRIQLDQLEEIARAQKAYELGIPTPKIVGEILDKGNTYAFFEYIPALNLDVAYKRVFYKDGGYLDPWNIYLKTTYKEEDFQGKMRRLKGYISNSAQKKIRDLWLEAREDIELRQLYMWLKNVCFETYQRRVEKSETELRRGIRQSFEKIWGRNQFYLKTIEKKLLPFLGTSSVEFIQKLDDAKSIEEVEQFFTELKKKMRPVDQRVSDFEKQWTSEAIRDIFGFDFKAERERLEKLCEEKGIEHKDFNSRNLLVPWDFEQNRPMTRGENEPKLYIIDWEVEKKSYKKD